jgi:hypothetical protein
VADGICEYLGACITTCTTPSCVANCFESFDVGFQAAGSAVLFGCARGCTAVCGGASDFACLDEYTWFGSDDGPVQARMQFVEYPVSTYSVDVLADTVTYLYLYPRFIR